MIVWIGLYAIAFHPRGIARTYQVVMAAAFAVALASSDAVVAGMVAWLVVVASSVAASEIFGGMLTTMRLLAVTDPLTGLPNRQALDDLVDHHVRTASQCGVGAVLAVIDLDGLKQVNDVHGHLSGDRFLVRTAAALRDALGSRARLLRIGGDEFLALLPDTTPEAADRRLQSLQAGAALPFSYGLVAVDGTGDLDMWLAQADQRMYAQKRCRKERRSTTPVQPPVLHS
jgi:diguanylate cyclase (GGDEF)-like protein